MCAHISQFELIEKLEIFKIKGKDKRGHKLLRIIGKFFPGKFFFFFFGFLNVYFVGFVD